MRGVHKGRPTLDAGCGRPGAALFWQFTVNSLVKATDVGVTDGF